MLSSSVLLPGQTATHSPGQNTGQLSLELVREGGIAFVFGNSHREGDKPETFPDGVVCPRDDGLMVGGKKGLMCRPKLPEILPHTPCTNGVPTGGFLHKYLSESAALLSFDSGDEPLTKKVRAFGGVTVVVTHQEKLRRGFHAVGTKESPQCVQECALAVASFPPQNEQDVLAYHACEGIAHRSL